MNGKLLKEFLAIVKTKDPILGYSQDEIVRKKRFLALGAKVAADLAERLGCKARARINPAGPAVSGEAYILTDEWEIMIGHHVPRNTFGDFYIRRGGKDAPTVWCKWEELENMDGLVGRLRRDKRLSATLAERKKAANE